MSAETETSGDAPNIDQGEPTAGKLVTEKVKKLAKKIRMNKSLDDASYIMCAMDKGELHYNIESFRIGKTSKEVGCSFNQFKANLEKRKD